MFAVMAQKTIFMKMLSFTLASTLAADNTGEKNFHIRQLFTNNYVSRAKICFAAIAIRKRTIVGKLCKNTIVVESKFADNFR